MSNLISARNGFGTVLSLCTQASTVGTFSAVAGITSLNVPKKTLGTIDVTYHASPDSYDEVIPGGVFKQAPISLTGIMITCSSFFSYTSAYSMFDMSSWMENGTLIGWKIEVSCTASSANVWTGNGFITDFGFDYPFNEVAKFTATITPTGKPLFGDT